MMIQSYMVPRTRDTTERVTLMIPRPNSMSPHFRPKISLWLRPKGRRATRIIALSASVPEGDREGLVEAGCEAFVSKPYREGLLFETLGRSFSLLANPFRKVEHRKELPPEMMTWFRLGPAIFVGAGATLLSHWGEL